MAPVPDSRPRLVPYLVSAASVAFVGVAAHVLTRFVPLPHVSIVFLAAVIEIGRSAALGALAGVVAHAIQKARS